MELILKFGHTLWYVVLPFIILLGVLVFVHELGHFLVARWCKVRVEVFSLGFGKKLLQYKRGDTNYCLSLIPLGGYVKMFGEQPGENIAPELKSVSFTHKTVLQRMAIVLAGPMMNLLFAIFIFGVVASIGIDQKPAILGDVTITSKAFEFGFRPGDKILKVDGESVQTWEQMQVLLNDKIGREISFEIASASDNTVKTLTAQITSTENPNPLALSKIIGTVDGFQLTSRGTHIAVVEGSLAASLGLKTGDLIKSVNSQEVLYWRQLESVMKNISAGQSISLAVSRIQPDSEKTEELSVNLTAPKEGRLISLGLESPDLYLAMVFPGSPAEKAGFLINDRITEINSVKMNSWDDVLNTIKKYDESSGQLKIGVLRHKESKSLIVTPQMTSHMSQNGKEEKRFTIGISPMISIATEKNLIVKAGGVGKALSAGVQKSYEITVMTLLSFVRLIEGEISPKNVGGVLSIGAAASESFKAGINYFLQMMGIISISLFVLNLLPIPVLDGGHLVFYSIELLRGSPISLKNMELAQQVGLVLLMSLMLFALYNDFSRFLGFGSY